MHMLTGARMNELQFPRMKALPFQSFFRAGSTVDAVSEKRMPDAGHVNPNLMRPPCLQTAAHPGIPVVPGQDLPMCHCRAAVRYRHGHAFAVRRMPPDGPVDDPAFLPQSAAYHRLVYP